MRSPIIRIENDKITSESPLLNIDIENNNENIEVPMLPETAVPPLQLLMEDPIDLQETEEKIMENVSEVVEIHNISEIHCDNHNNNNNNSNNNNNRNNNISNALVSSTGRVLESEREWQLRPKVTFDNLNRMIFRPLRMKCSHCSEAYTKTHDLYAHIRTHQLHTKCPHCGKVLNSMATFVYHVRTHTHEKPYYCPLTDCKFKNAVKYNLKVHLACVSHGGKANLKKYAKVLDLDVCDKSLRKRKDNSMHELGTRRSRKKRKLNKNIIKNNNNNFDMNNEYNEYNVHMNINNNINEYDPFAAQLLFSLSGMPPVFDHHTIISPKNEINIKSENQNINCIQNDTNIKIEPQPQQYYDPLLYGCYTSESTSSVWNTTEHIPQIKLEDNTNINVNNESILFPKQEPIFPTINDSYMNTHPINYFSYPQPQPYYINYDNTVLYSYHSSNNQINDNNNNEQDNSQNTNIDVPPSVL